MSTKRKLLTDLSKSELTIPAESTIDATLIVASALVRIANSQDLIAHNYTKMITDLEYYRKAYADKKEEIAQLQRTNRALKGHITRLQNKKNEN